MKGVLHTDGGARGNPGPAAIGVILESHGRTLVSLSEGIGTVTNNVAEYAALLRGLEEAQKHGVTDLECFLDSELVVRQLNREYKVRDQGLAPLFVRVWNLAQSFHAIRFRAVPRSENRGADALVNQALDQAEKSPPRKSP